MKKIFLIILLLTINLSVFAKDNTQKKPVVVTFYQKDCEQCDLLNEVKQEVMEKYEGKVNFAKVAIDYDDCDFKKLINRYNVKTAPTTLFIKEGTTIKVEGYINQKSYLKNIQQIMEQ